MQTNSKPVPVKFVKVKTLTGIRSEDECSRAAEKVISECWKKGRAYELSLKFEKIVEEEKKALKAK